MNLASLRSSRLPARRSALLGLAVAAALAACSWSVPADPGLNAARRGRAGAPEGTSAPDSFSPAASFVNY